MRPSSSFFLLPFSFILLCSAAMAARGQELLPPNTAAPGGEGPTPEELVKQVRDGQRKDIQAAVERAMKEAARRKKKGEDSGDVLLDQLLNPGLPNPRQLGPDFGRSAPQFDGTKPLLIPRQQMGIYREGRFSVQVDESGKLHRMEEGTAEGTAPGGAGTGSALKIESPKKRSLWDRLLGRKKEPELPQTLSQAVQAGGGAPALGLGGGARGEPRTTLRQRVATELASKRLEAGAPRAAGTAATASVDDLPPARSAASGASGPGDVRVVLGMPPNFPRPAPPAEVKSEADLRAEAERRFRDGLTARDLVERDWAFRYAAAFRREEALPALSGEVRSCGPLAALAAACLGEIGHATPEAEAALAGALAARNADQRRAAAQALGQLRAASAANPLLKALKTEQNYIVRGVCCDALGRIGARVAAGALRERMEAKDESELVRAQAAAALARLGERTGERALEAWCASPVPALQVLGLAGLLELNGPSLPGYLTAALRSPYEEVWVLAVRAYPRLGAARALPALQLALAAEAPQVRWRAALALGLLGSAEGLPYVEQALLEGTLMERQMAAEMLGLMGYRSAIPLLIERLRDPHAAVRSAAALALARLDAREALPALLQAARGPKGSYELALARGALPEVEELLILMCCVRALRGEEPAVEFQTAPDYKNVRWPEYESQLLKYQLDLLKNYRLIEVMGAGGKPVAAVLRDPQGHEQLYREGEMVAAGFRVRDLYAGGAGDGRTNDPPWVTLARGDSRITLIVGREAEPQLGRSASGQPRAK